MGVMVAALAAIAKTTPASDDRDRAANLMAEGLKRLGQRTPETLHEAAADYQEAADLWRKLGDTPKQLGALLNLAGAHFYLHEISQASAFLNQALDLARASGNRAGEGTVLVSLAILHDNPGDRQQAIDELAQARKIFEALGDKNAELQVVGMQGSKLQMAKDFPAAIEAYERGLALSREAGNRKVEAMMLLRLAQMNEMLPQREASEKAAALFAQAVPLLQADSDRLNEAMAWWGLGMMNDNLDRIDQARDAYLKALPLLPDLKNSQAGGRILLSLAIDEEKLQQMEKAVEHYEQALPLLASAHDELSQYNGEMHLGKVRETLGDNAKALEAYQAAVAVAHAAEDKSAGGTAYLRIGTLQFNSCAWNEALTAYGEAERLFEAAGNGRGEASALAGMGGAYMSVGEYKKKLDCSMRELALVQDGDGPVSKAAALLAVGDSYNALHESKKALDYLDQALTLNEQEPAGKATVLAEKGEVYYEMGNQTKALQLQSDALDIVRSLGNPVAEAKVLNDIGLTYSAMGEKAKALEAFQKVLESARARKDIQQQSATLNNLARLHQDFGDNKEADKLYAESLDLVHQAGDRYQEAHTRSALGMLYHSFGEEQKAIDTLNEALEEDRSIEDRHGEAVTLNNLAIVYSDTGETQKALDIQNSARSIFRDLDDESENAGALSNIGSIYQSLGLYERAEVYFLQAREKQQQFGDEDGEAATLNNLGVVKQNQGEPLEALRYFEQSLPLIEKLGNRTAQARLLASMAIALSDTGHPPAEAIEKLNRSLQIARETGDVDIEALALHNLGSVYSQLGEPDKALEHYRQALGLWSQIRSESAAAISLGSLAYCDFDLGRIDEAKTLARQESAAKLTILSKILSFTSEQQRLAYLDIFHPYRLFPILKGTETDLAAAVLRYKGVVLDSIIEDRLLAEASQGSDDQKLVEQLNVDKRQLGQLLLQPAQKLSVETNQRIEALEGEVEKIEGQLAQHVAGLGQARHALGVTPEQVQPTIPNDGALIEYLRYGHYLGKGKSEPRYGAIVLFSKGAPLWIPLGKANEIEHLVRRYGTLVRGSPQEEELSANLQALYEALWAPIGQALPSQTKRIIISPDGQLNFVSFATLLTKDKQFLAEKYDVQYVASGRDLLRELKPSIAKEVVLFANPDFDLVSTPMLAKADNGSGSKSIRGSEKREIEDWSFESLTGTQKERDELIEKFAGWGWTPSDFTAKGATKEALLKIHSPYILHLATHGFFAKEDPNSAKTETESSLSERQSVTKSRFFKNPMHRSGLALAGAQTTIEAWKRDEVPPVENDGILTAEDVSTLDLQGTWLVTLSACDTGSGEARAGEGVMGLRRGFIQAGAQNLLMTLWPISDEVTVQIMSDFYDAAHNTGNAPEALAEVQRNWLVKLRTEKGLAQAVNLAGPFIMSSQGKP